MVDVNFLKKVNDTYGHEKGNSYLKNAADLICSVFGSEHLYRIGDPAEGCPPERRKDRRLQAVDEYRDRPHDLPAAQLRPAAHIRQATGLCDGNAEGRRAGRRGNA
jgi:hypothetical protein